MDDRISVGERICDRSNRHPNDHCIGWLRIRELELMRVLEEQDTRINKLEARIRALATPPDEPCIPGALMTAEKSAEAYQGKTTAAVERLWEDYLRCLPGAESRLVDYTKALERECLARRDADLTAINARDAADIVRPPETERRECWEIRNPDGVAVHRQGAEPVLQSGEHDTKHRMVELRPGEQIVGTGFLRPDDFAALGIEVDR